MSSDRADTTFRAWLYADTSSNAICSCYPPNNTLCAWSPRCPLLHHSLPLLSSDPNTLFRQLSLPIPLSTKLFSVPASTGVREERQLVHCSGPHSWYVLRVCSLNATRLVLAEALSFAVSCCPTEKLNDSNALNTYRNIRRLALSIMERGADIVNLA